MSGSRHMQSFIHKRRKRAYIKEEERRRRRKKNRLSLYSLSHNTLRFCLDEGNLIVVDIVQMKFTVPKRGGGTHK